MSSVSPEESPVFNCSSLLTTSRDQDSECVRLGPSAWWGWELVETRGESVRGRERAVCDRARIEGLMSTGGSDPRVFRWCNVFCSAQVDVFKTTVLALII